MVITGMFFYSVGCYMLKQSYIAFNISFKLTFVDKPHTLPPNMLCYLYFHQGLLIISKKKHTYIKNEPSYLTAQLGLKPTSTKIMLSMTLTCYIC